ncbi:MAG: pro-sigmaK processing inhibitor BofA family protein [Candidatus Altiarchaeales archaeon]|nr:pro-sigmaK processing inhibitor BofA family protein [Candidatus Altiarchaeota archaeon]MBU4341316.1 pro-sigmaK processing inhibitor BofA family protein [Candidatus Altiarchaeota archaeon]MBU4406702.1 pro-sigmaK processing inhibitor BofA family protein [Candidatus Altiarchaeota archaeon]MCG2781981.1 pro-sigmaK processing inhibitor BofA family protein [Candidatus Altiarchaeales archaeon]
MKSKTLHFLIISLLFLSIVQSVSAEDTLKPALEQLYNAVQQIVDKIQEIVYGFFPGLEVSVEEIKAIFLESPVLEWFPIIQDYLWLFYVAAFFAILAILAKVWGMSKHFIINSVVGIIILLILVHYFDVEIQVTILKLAIIAIFGIPGVLFVLIAHYLGIPL